jgi:hypothetical protein
MAFGQLFTSNQERIYNSYNLVFDEVYFDGDSVYVPGKNWFTNDGICYYSDSTSILGREIRSSASGAYRFVLYDNDTLTMHFEADTGETWIAYESTDGIIEATVTDISNEEVFGTSESVKTISLQMLDEELEPINAEVNFYQFRIGSISGLIEFPNLTAFPQFYQTPSQSLYDAELNGISPDVGIQDLTTFEIYDFQPGDEIHYEEGSQSFSNYNVTQYAEEILARTDYADSIVYTINVTTYNPDAPTPVSTYVEMRTIEPIPLLDTPAGQPYILESYVGYLPWIEEGIHGLTKRTIHPGPVLEYVQMYDCFSIIIDYGCFQFGIDHYIEGLGGPYFQCANDLTSSTWRELLYYNKDGIEWGGALSTRTVSDRIDIRFIPNPASSEFQVQTDQQISLRTIRVFDMRGRLIRQFQGGLSRYSVDGMEAGIYIVEMEASNGQFLSKRLVIENK